MIIFSYGQENWRGLSNSLFDAAKSLKPSSNAQNGKDKPIKSANPPASVTNVERFVDLIMDKTSKLLLNEVSGYHTLYFLALNFSRRSLGPMTGCHTGN